MVHLSGITGILAMVFLASPGLTNQHVLSTYSHNPCGAEPLGHEGWDRPIQNHYSETALKMTRSELKMALDDFYNLNKTKLTRVYSGKIVTPTHMDHNLPHRQYWEYIGFKRAHKNNMTSEIMVHHILPKLLSKLTVFGKAFDKLSEIVEPKVKNTEEILLERRWIILRFKAKLRSLCCEIETSMNISNLNKPKEADPALDRVGNDWHQRPNLTTLLTRDMSIFIAYKVFLEESHRIQLDYLGDRRHSKRSHSRFRKRIALMPATLKMSKRKEHPRKRHSELN